MIPIPAIDILDGNAVRLTRGDYDEVTVYADDPVELAREWEAAGAELLHVVDLDGARDGAPRSAEVIRELCGACAIPVQTGGGIRDLAAVGLLLDSGVERIVIGTAAVTEPEFLDEALESFGPERFAVALDSRRGMISLSGWMEESEITAADLAGQLTTRGVERFLVTAIEVDGTMEGPDLDLLALVSSRTPAPLIASGGIGSLADLEELRDVPDGNIEGVILGKALYEKAFTLQEAAVVLGGGKDR
ncbi:MAG: 1-(5-phosphoribosyl)-5-[(5-phosphoribosylamino)methylideneamino]imidazole-4-carboxamide isomerase [Solirubrobacterales bacterium]